MRFTLSIIILLFSVAVKAKEMQIVKVVNLNDAQSDSLSYFHQLINDALHATADMGSYKVEQVDFNVAQKRSMRLLKLPGVLDVMHTMKDKEWEQSLIRVPQPLLNGTLGTRALLVRAEDKDKFERISIEDLKKKLPAKALIGGIQTFWNITDLVFIALLSSILCCACYRSSAVTTFLEE